MSLCLFCKYGAEGRRQLWDFEVLVLFFILREFWAYWLRILQPSSLQSVRKPRYRADGYESSSTMDATEILKLLGIVICFIAVIVGTAKVLKLYSSFGDPVLKKLTRLVIVISAIPCMLRLIALAISLIAGKYTTLWFLTPNWFLGLLAKGNLRL